MIKVTHYQNNYECSCGTTWSDSWCCCCDDKCVQCGASCSPVDSDEIETFKLTAGGACPVCDSAHEGSMRQIDTHHHRRIRCEAVGSIGEDDREIILSVTEFIIGQEHGGTSARMDSVEVHQLIDNLLSELAEMRDAQNSA